jgi:hypothetical protein
MYSLYKGLLKVHTCLAGFTRLEPLCPAAILDPLDDSGPKKLEWEELVWVGDRMRVSSERRLGSCQTLRVAFRDVALPVF